MKTESENKYEFLNEIREVIREMKIKDGRRIHGFSLKAAKQQSVKYNN